MSESKNNPSSDLQDIPLTKEEPQHDLTGPTESNIRLSKTNSLKRFFKLKEKPSSENEKMEKPQKPDKEENETAAAEKSKDPSTGKRFHLRVGNKSENKVGSSTAAAGISSATLGRAAGSSQSRQTLKGSISNYWNTMFKRNASKRNISQTADNDAQPVQAEPLPTTIEEPEQAIQMEAPVTAPTMKTTVSEPVHTLPKSDDTEKSTTPIDTVIVGTASSLLAATGMTAASLTNPDAITTTMSSSNSNPNPNTNTTSASIGGLSAASAPFEKPAKQTDSRTSKSPSRKSRSGSTDRKK